MSKQERKKHQQPPQHQAKQPGIESEMRPLPIAEDVEHQGSNKLKGKIAIITGGDSGIGRAVAIAYAKEGANILISYLNEDNDAKETQSLVQQAGGQCVLLAGNIAEENFCQHIVDRAIKEFGRIDILINNAAVQYPKKEITDITHEQLLRTFSTNLFPLFYLTKAALPHLKKGSVIINTTSVTAYKGNPQLIDYSSTKGAIVSFTRSLALSLIKRGIRVNAVAPGPIWTPLIPASFSAEKVAEFGEQVPMERVGQPCEVAGCYVFLASHDSSYMTGQVLHPNGGIIVNG
ncbi:MAG: 3-oxoacyl-(acyl-carrier-protein) reductase [Gammaproteobacteria bacterium]|jgi:NAD(P)-dependent dehydrogenase (short-subunit alcohol dehydrogenase family)|nr:3-oxoacyl-(acyl-carrier-protein) reductase [Gammaproteobacteria bacterium]